MDHISMMGFAESAAQHSDCPECKVGAVIALAYGGEIVSSNTAAWDSTNDNHAESKLIVMAGLARYSLAGSTLYVTRRPCARCTAMLLPLGLKAVYYRDAQPEMGHLQALRDAGVHVDGRWIAGQQPIPLEQVQQSWADRWPKRLDQSVFKSAPKWAKWAVVIESGDAYLSEDEPSLVRDDSDLKFYWSALFSRQQLAGSGYDSSDWQRSKIAKAGVQS